MRDSRGRFVKGNEGFWLNKHRTKETRRKIRKNLKGRFCREDHSNWKGGIREVDGYIYVLCKEHPFAPEKGLIAQHRLIMEEHLGRFLTRKEVIHHVNGIKNDNRIENLTLCKNNVDHQKHHKRYFYVKKEWLEKEYNQNKKSIAQIAKEAGFSYAVVYDRLSRYNIKRRNRKELSVNRKRKDGRYI